MTTTEREQQRRARTASEERSMIFWAVVVGVWMGLFVIIFLLVGA